MSHCIALRIFLRFLTKKNLHITDKSCVAEFILHLKERGNSDITIAHRLTVLKSFFNYLVNKGIVPRRTLAKIEKSSPYPPNVFKRGMNHLNIF